MIINKAYIHLKDKKNEFLIEEIIRSSFENVEISVENDVLAVSTINDFAFQLKLTKINKLVMSDFNIKVSFLIVPYFDEIFKKYLLKINGGVFTVFEIFLRSINEIETKKDCKEIIDSIEKKDLDTIKAFLMCNGNSSVTANELYLHRNSLNYRMNSFINNTSMDIRDINTLMFLKLILCIS